MARKGINSSGLGQQGVLQTLFMVLLWVLIWYPPFFRGMFFDYELSYFHLFSSALLIVFIVAQTRAEIKLTNNLMDYASFGLILAYLLSTFAAVNVRDSVSEVMKLANYFMIFLMVAFSVRSFLDLNRIMTVLYLSGLGVALRGLAAAYGIWEYNGAFAEGMINSTLQYHNATAIFLAAAAILGLYLVAKADQLWLKMLYGAGNYLIFITMMGAVSRGAMLVYLAVLVPLIIGMPKGFRAHSVFNVILLFLSFFLTSKNVLVYGFETWYHVLWLFIGMLINACGQWAIERLAAMNIWSNKKLMLGSAAVTLVGIIAMGAFLSTRILPDNVVDRFKNISLKHHSVQERFTFYKDSMKLIADNPVLGTGGGGWSAIYRKYQTYNYNSTEVHNQFLQTWVEAGTIGFIFYLALWAGFFYYFLKVYRGTGNAAEKAFVWTAGMAALAIGLHSSIDFSLSLGSVSIFLWTLFGLIRGQYRLGVENTSKQSVVLGDMGTKALVSVVGIGFFALSFSLALSNSYLEQGKNAYNSGDLAGSINYFEKSVSADPFIFNIHSDLSQLYLTSYSQSQNPQDLELSVEHAEKSVRLNSGNAQGYWFLSQAYFSVGRLDDAVKAVEDAQKIIPMRQEGYDRLAETYTAAGRGYMQMGQQAKAKEMFQKALEVPELINKQIASLSEEAKAIWNPPMLQVTPTIQTNMDEARKSL